MVPHRMAHPEGAVRLGLISDTHGQLRAEVFGIFEGVDQILHAGDIGDADILDDLRALAPTIAVIGNTDGFPLVGSVPEHAELAVAGRRIVVTHGHLLPSSPRPETLAAAFPDADIIVYGHTHKPFEGRHAGRLVINPGAAGPARFKLKPSVALLTLSDEGECVRFVAL